MSDDKERADDYGPNVWLIDEMYREYKEHPESLSETWREFFSDYRPAVGRAAPSVAVVEVAAPTAPAPALAPAAPTKVPTPAAPSAPTPTPPVAVPLRGPAARLVENMERSLRVPTATTARTIPVKLLEENRAILNDHLADVVGGKVSFTHLLAWAVVRALAVTPSMQAIFMELDGTPHRISPEHVNLGLAVDLEKRGGSRSLVVPSIKRAEALDFAAFFAAYNDLIRRAHAGQLTPEDFADTTATLTNPGMLGTTQSVPRLMAGQSLIVGTGSIDYPAEYQSADRTALARMGVGKVVTVTCTYDHRVIQGAESGAFLGLIGRLLAGEDGFYETIFASLHVPHKPLRLARDANPFLADDGGQALVRKSAGVLHLINMYRVRGHLVAHLNPLGQEVPSHAELDLAHHGLTVWDLDREFYVEGLAGRDRATLREVLHLLQYAYTGPIGVEYMFIQEPDQKTWIQQRVEGVPRSSWVTADDKRRILAQLNAAEAFERFLHTKYIGHKRFSLEGAEALIAILDRLLSAAIAAGVEDVAMGMSHRGRLNVLANILGKSYEKIFREFDGDLDPFSREGSGDVKYHLGGSGTFHGPTGASLRVVLASNPSHLEAADPVVEGMTRAMQDMRGDTARERVLPVLIHGDAAFSGQGVVAETLNMSALSGYRTGGTVHIVVNNGIGFTTSPADARSSVYATDVAKMVQAPVLHVNGDDPEACVRAIDLAFAFRERFKKDVVVDMVCYRRHGHNEADEPAFTQPLMYAKIREKRSVRKLYTETLVNRGDLSLPEAEAALNDFQARLEAAFAATRESAPPEVCPLPAEPTPLPVGPVPAVSRAVIERIVEIISTVPEGFGVHPKLARHLTSHRDEIALGAATTGSAVGQVEWATAESLAFGSLLLEGKTVRLAGQDSRRGTFSQRHAVLVDQHTGAEYVSLQHLDPQQGAFLLFDSLLSEYAALGFEYGYSVARPDALVLWEAQFGDFANGAQIIIDQFLAAASEKWNQRSRLTLLLPHGYEGQGPEHSSARVERFLQLSARGNWRVAVPTTAAQYFHLLRSQGHLAEPTPLVILTPKSLLRAAAAKSRPDELTTGFFRPLLLDPEMPETPASLLLCSGKVVYHLMEHRRAQGVRDTAIVRVEQLYPFPAQELSALLATLAAVREVTWVQEEPANMGAWSFVLPHLQAALDGRSLAYAGRPASPSPATGSSRMHQAEQERLVTQAFRSGA
ncbi:MAG: multifunctional oxoglutarate decarboxylase/oxoglutarate dehydrogenase thiamine pyrophosphate-binding subunit/dihydrolipoyllysine-residue succinyltransferase subunit [Acidobacteriota bacterium]